jgi:hypothetical protein
MQFTKAVMKKGDALASKNKYAAEKAGNSS